MLEPEIVQINPYELHVKIGGWNWIVYHCEHYQAFQEGSLVPGKHSRQAIPTNDWFLDEQSVFGRKPPAPGPWFFVDRGWTRGLPYSHGYSSWDEAIEIAAAFQSYMEDLA